MLQCFPFQVRKSAQKHQQKQNFIYFYPVFDGYFYCKNFQYFIIRFLSIFYFL